MMYRPNAFLLATAKEYPELADNLRAVSDYIDNLKHACGVAKNHLDQIMGVAREGIAESEKIWSPTLGKTVEWERQPEAPADPQNTADCGEEIDMPPLSESVDTSLLRDFDSPVDRATDWDKATAPAFRHAPNDTAKTSMSEPVPISTPGDDSAPAVEGTQLADTAATPEGWIDVPDEPGALRRLKPGDRFKVGDVECAVVPVDMPANFGDWVERQMPPDTIICDPQWWAPRFWRAVFRNIER